jgi:colicin import membrane protein
LSPQSSAKQITKEDFTFDPAEPDRSLWHWVIFSGFLHVALVGVLFFFLSMPVFRTVNYPVYTVDLVGGEKVGRFAAGVTHAPAPQPKETKPIKSVPLQTARPEKETKAILKKKEAEKPPKPEAAAQKPASNELPDALREKLIQAALERVKQRATDSRPPSPAGAETAGEKHKVDAPAKAAEALGGGVGEGVGAAARGEGGRGGGGIEKGIEFVAYYDRMLRSIKENWTWIGRKSNLEIIVRFGVRENGEIFGLRVAQPSGDASFDDSVIRAVRKVNPLAPPPEAYRSDFRDVELIFRPKDLRG